MIEFVAEIGSNHKGIKSLAFEMIRQFSQAGATICKFQLGHDPDDPIRYIDPWVEDIARWCDSFGAEFMASIWSQEGLDAARSVSMKRYKIAHQKRRDSELYKSIVREGKETFISNGLNGTINGNVRGVYVSTDYPCYDFDIPEAFSGSPGGVFGYSSHMHGIADSLVAVSRGAKYVEKHVTLDKTEESIKDNSFAISVREFANLVQLGKEIHRLI